MTFSTSYIQPTALFCLLTLTSCANDSSQIDPATLQSPTQAQTLKQQTEATNLAAADLGMTPPPQYRHKTIPPLLY